MVSLKDLVRRVEPDAIVVELSRDRISSLYPVGATSSRTGTWGEHWNTEWLAVFVGGFSSKLVPNGTGTRRNNVMSLRFQDFCTETGCIWHLATAHSRNRCHLAADLENLQSELVLCTTKRCFKYVFNKITSPKYTYMQFFLMMKQVSSGLFIKMFKLGHPCSIHRLFQYQRAPRPGRVPYSWILLRPLRVSPWSSAPSAWNGNGVPGNVICCSSINLLRLNGLVSKFFVFHGFFFFRCTKEELLILFRKLKWSIGMYWYVLVTLPTELIPETHVLRNRSWWQRPFWTWDFTQTFGVKWADS